MQERGFLHMVKLTWRLQESPISEISGFVSPQNNFALIVMHRFIGQSICQDGKPMLFNIVYQEAIAELAAIQHADIVVAAHAGGSV